MDDDGYVYYVDRMKDCIRRRGENISSWEVERTISTDPRVAEVAIVGVPSELSEEEVLAVVVLRPGAGVSVEDLLAHCAKNLAKYKVPASISVLDTLPKTTVNKTDRNALRERAKGENH